MNKVFENLAKWIQDESIHKRKILNLNWNYVDHGRNVPQQLNSFDCGLFLLMMCEFLHEQLPLENYSQANMTYFRERVCFDILLGHLCYPSHIYTLRELELSLDDCQQRRKLVVEWRRNEFAIKTNEEFRKKREEVQNKNKRLRKK